MEPTHETRQEEVGAPNLDAMDDTALAAFALSTRGVRPLAQARRLFGRRGAGEVKATVKLHCYAWNLITARSCRVRGDIDTAIYYEGICDRIYQQLPEWARW